MPGLAQATHRFHPPERLFNPLALDRADAIAGMTSRARVDRRAGEKTSPTRRARAAERQQERCGGCDQDGIAARRNARRGARDWPTPRLDHCCGPRCGPASTYRRDAIAGSALESYIKSRRVPITGYTRMMNVQYFIGIQNSVCREDTVN